MSSTLELLNEVLEEQHTLTAVERFSQKHATATTPALSTLYEELLPASKPQEGEQYAFKIDLNQCSGCKSCVAACHSLNGLDEEESFRVAGTIHGGTPVEPYLQTVTSACHHCIDPACLKGCPTKAYEKDPVTGIVKHLDDQCIGCQYCTLMCPYDVPKFNASLGIVRKCDMCTQRLADNEAPACAQSCPTQAISITIVNTQDVIKKAESGDFIEGAPTPEITQPTTQYISNKKIPTNSISSDYYDVQLQHAHFSLIALLIFSQLSVGILGTKVLATLFGASDISALESSILLSITTLIGGLAIVLSTFHLGRPLGAFRAILGIKTSWMSREVFMIGNYMGAVIATLMVSAIGFITIDIPLMDIIEPIITKIPLEPFALLMGLGTVFSSSMIYVATKRPFWRASHTIPKFFLTIVILGTIGFTLSSIALENTSNSYLVPTIIAMILSGLIKIIIEFSTLLSLGDSALSPMKRTAVLLAGKLKWLGVLRMSLGLFGYIVFPLALIKVILDQDSTNTLLFFSIMAFIFSLAGEFCERFTFFAVVDKPRMPREMI